MAAEERGATDADLRVLSRREKRGASTGRA